MKKSKLEYFKKKLLKKHKEITEKYAKNKGNSKEDVRDGTEDYIDYAVNSYAKEFLLSLTEMDRKQLVLIEEALRRIKSGVFGKCQQCSQEISSKRLEVAPWARHCIRCQELEEQGILPHYSFRREEEFELEDSLEHEEFEGEEREGFEENYRKGSAYKKRTTKNYSMENLNSSEDEEE
ncbi:MAG: TraR/DksA C4-type zinc finger protein [Acidobacteriota bacterium]